MDTKALRQKILDLAIRAKLVPQDPNDEPASVLLERIRAEKQQMVKDGKLKPKDIKNDTVIFKGEDNLHYEKFSDGTVKCIEDEIPFDVPNNWEWCRLQTICTKEIKRGKAPKYEEKSSVIVFAQKCNTKSGFIDISKAKFLAQNTLKKYADEDFLYYNDIIINSTGTGTLGRVGIYKKEDDIYSIKIVPDSHITTVRTIPSEINAQYIYYFLKFNQLYFENSGVGSTNQKELKPEVISTFLIAIPPLNEQNAIIGKVNMVNKHLSNLDSEKEQLKELISSMKSKILDLAIRGKLVPQDPNDEPASVLLERIRAEKEEQIKQGKIKRNKKESVIFKGSDNSYYRTINSKTELLEIGYDYELPDGWEFITVGEYSKKVTDQVASGSFAALRENVKSLKTPDYAIMVKTADFSNGFTKNLTYTDKHGYEFLENSNLFGGELILNNIGSIGKVFIVPKLDHKMTLAPNSIMIRLNSEEYRDYLYYFFSSPLGYSALMSISSGAAVTKFNKTDLKNLVIPIPPLVEQKRIVDEIEKIFATLDDIANQVV